MYITSGSMLVRLPMLDLVNGDLFCFLSDLRKNVALPFFLSFPKSRNRKALLQSIPGLV